jgi:hypothetical protein
MVLLAVPISELEVVLRLGYEAVPAGLVEARLAQVVYRPEPW